MQNVELSFLIRDTVVKAEQGKGVIWSAEWTHPHRELRLTLAISILSQDGLFIMNQERDLHNCLNYAIIPK